ncbi:DUF5672 family protein [Rhodohalobacter sp. SW132]|uniref:DUF5672 family protein n=1 Tax=Rhodohalobacter sp. SW132 TaxID=2293433 RepID=UPI000E24524C|nr:DUF5672 family protein [Rhodohalobacter sp. SW132]
MSKNQVAIVIPLSTRPGLSESELISLKHLEHYLSDYDRFFIAPENIKVEYEGIPVIRMADKYFGSLNAHTRLSLSNEFYENFSGYKFMLMYHLDCLVFDSGLDWWCDMDYDLIGPPWIKGPDLPWLEEEGVGNTGFSLRKIESFLKLLNSKVRWEGPRSKLNKVVRSETIADKLKQTGDLAASPFPGRNNIHAHIKYHIEKDGHDDRFLHEFATKYYPDFNIAPVEVALKFGFEANPRICFERNQKNIPFGCHAWETYDKEFWEPFMLDH